MKVVVLLSVALSGIAYSQGPWLGGQKEYALGILLQEPTVLGLYVNRKTGTSVGDFVNKTSVDLRLGWMGWKVVNGTFGGNPCFVLDSDAYTTITLKGKTLQAYDTKKLARQTFVDDKGKILREAFQWEDGAGKYSAEAKYGPDSIELTTNSPKGAKTTTVFPAGGMDQFAAAFKPMVKNNEIVLAEKTFAILDPVSGAAQKVTARVAGHFDWSRSAGQVNKKGFCIEFEWPDHKEKAYITDKGELCKVDLPEGRILLWEIEK